MEVLEFTESSSIAKIQFDDEQNQVGIAYTYKPEKLYIFNCNDLSLVKEKVKTAESVGKLVSELRKDGTLMNL